MRKFGKFLGRVLLLLIIGVGIAYATAPKESVNSKIAFDPNSLGDDLDAYLAASEAKYIDIIPTTQKQIIWHGAKRQKTPFSIIYIHGFSATSHEIRPVPELVSKALGANLFYTRLAGHGRGSAALAEPNADDWLNDTAEALAIGRRLGDRVLVITTSTGGTLGAIAATDPTLAKDVAGIVFVSPNFGIDRLASFILNLPYAREWGPLVVGQTRSFDVRNAEHARLWTTTYPTVSVFPMEALVQYALSLDYSQAKTPALFIFSMQDKVVQPKITEEIATKWGGPVEIYHPQLTPKDDPYSHVITGNIMSPDQTAPTVAHILEWAKGL